VLLLQAQKLFCLLAVSCLLLTPMAEAAAAGNSAHSLKHTHWLRNRRLQVGEAAVPKCCWMEQSL
jgi:hypothetical protein